jgi:glutamate-ammonia-ligase adenylyltransferase
MTFASHTDIATTIDALPAELHGAATRWFERLAESQPQAAIPAAAATALVRVIAASEFAAQVILRDWQWFTDNVSGFSAPPGKRVLDEHVRDVSAETVDVLAAKQQLRRFRHRFMLQVLWREISGDASLDDTLHALSDLADRQLQAGGLIAHRTVAERFGVVRDAAGNAVTLVTLGMGKLGGRELNFSSDIDLVFLYPAGRDSDGRKSLSAQEYFTRVARQLIVLLDEATADGFCFRIDTRLRPFGDSGPPVVSFAALEAYLLQHGRDWERYAYVKARIVGIQPTDAVATELTTNLIQPFVYRRYIDFGVFESLRDMHAMIAAEVRRRELANNVKLGPGGIREIEFIVQSLQLVRGGSDEELRSRELQPTLVKLVETRAIARETALELLQAYEFLRRLENFIQAIRDQQTHDLPGDRNDRARLCLAMQCWDWDALTSDLALHRDRVSSHFNEIARVGEQTEAATPLVDLWDNQADIGQWRDYLRQQGLPESSGLATELSQFASQGTSRQVDTTARRRLRRLLPQLLRLVAGTRDPVRTLRRTLDVVESVLRRSAYIALLNENRAALARFVELCSESAYMADQIARYPVLLDELLDTRAHSGVVSKDYLLDALQQREQRHRDADTEQLVALLARYQRAEMFNIAVADFNGVLPIMKVSDALTWLAEVVVERCLRAAWAELVAKHGAPCCEDEGENREVGFGVIGYGKLGGLELSYGSDLDLVFLHNSRGTRQQTNGDKPLDNPLFFARFVRRLTHMLTIQTGSGELYTIDTRLRPDGRSGVLVSSTDAFEKYQEEHAWTWEHQALLRARAVAGSSAVGVEFERIRSETLRDRVRRDSLRDDVISMRQRMRRELDRSAADVFDLKHGHGGVGDIEFLVQYLVLQHAREFAAVIEYSDNIRQLDALAASKVIPAATALRLQDAYRTYRRRMHRLVLDEQATLVSAAEFPDERAFVSSVWDTHLGV